MITRVRLLRCTSAMLSPVIPSVAKQSSRRQIGSHEDTKKEDSHEDCLLLRVFVLPSCLRVGNFLRLCRLDPCLCRGTKAHAHTRPARPPVPPHRSARHPSSPAGEQEASHVTITRDDWGIAHVHGKTDADAVFGMIYAQAEDDFPRIEANYLTASAAPPKPTARRRSGRTCARASMSATASSRRITRSSPAPMRS